MPAAPALQPEEPGTALLLVKEGLVVVLLVRWGDGAEWVGVVSVTDRLAER